MKEITDVNGRKLFITGPPGSGKSTAFLRCVEILKSSGFTVGGISTPERHDKHRRYGFDIVDLASGKRAVMAGIDIQSTARVGKYGVDVKGFESVALPALRNAIEVCDIVGIDEIGRMELHSRIFKRMVDSLLLGKKPVISVLHRAYVNPYEKYGTLFRVTPENRDVLPELLVSEILSSLE